MSSSKDALAQVFQTLADDLREKHGFSDDELHALLSAEETIPATAFDNNLTPLETLTHHLADDQLKKLNRPKQTLQNAQENARKKAPDGLTPAPSKHHIPITIFGDRTLSPLEHLCTHLKEQGLRNNEIAQTIGRNPRTVWTVLSRADKKRGERDE